MIWELCLGLSLDRDSRISADCSEAPEGRLEAEITYGHERFPATVTETNPKVYQINFRPRGKGTYKVWVVYSGLVLKGNKHTHIHTHTHTYVIL